MTALREKGRGGFTLLEMLFASAIFVIVVSQLAGVFIGAQRLLKRAFTEAELSLVSRQMRERLLFKARPDSGDKCCAGLLSAADQTVGWSSLQATIPCVDASTGLDESSAQSQFAIGSQWNSSRGDNDLMVWDQFNTAAKKWLFPSQMSCGWTWSDWCDTGGVCDGFADREKYAATKGQYYYLTIYYKANGVERKERVVVPVFGKVQE